MAANTGPSLAIQFAVALANKIGARCEGDETPWDALPGCPFCNYHITPNDADFPLSDDMAAKVEVAFKTLMPKMRPILHAQLGHLEVCLENPERVH